MKKIALLLLVVVLAGCGNTTASQPTYHYAVTVPRPGDTADVESESSLLKTAGCEVTAVDPVTSQIQTTCTEPQISNYINVGSWYSIIDSDNGGVRGQYFQVPTTTPQ